MNINTIVRYKELEQEAMKSIRNSDGLAEGKLIFRMLIHLPHETQQCDPEMEVAILNYGLSIRQAVLNGERPSTQLCQ